MKGSKWINNLTVGDDNIWKTSVGNERKGADNWEMDWRFLVEPNSSAQGETIEQKIKKLEESLQATKALPTKTTNKVYGTGQNLEQFHSLKFNKMLHSDIKPQDRKPKKDEAAK